MIFSQRVFCGQVTPDDVGRQALLCGLVDAFRAHGGLLLSRSPVTPARFAALLKMLAQDEINAHAAREVLTRLFESHESPEAIVIARGFKQVSDTGALEAMVNKVLSEQPSAVNDFKNGQGKAMGFLIGQVMPASGGKANPKMIRELLSGKLSAT